MDINASADDKSSSKRRLDTPPPRPPRSKQSMMDMAGAGGRDENMGMDMSNPAVQVMSTMGDVKKSLLKLGTQLPTLAQGIQQIISGLESVVPQQVADIVSGNPPGSGGSGLGAPGASQAPTAPPVQGGTP